jgi:SNF2 family DNA or RNA helicase
MLKDLAHSSKVIIWACLEQELDSLEEMLVKDSWGYVRVDGNTTHRIKEMEENFNTNPDCRVYLAQISTGIAITLNAAKHTIYYSRDWSLENRQQSLFRNFRIGQTKKTVVYDICARGSLEVQQLNALQRKTDVSKLLTDHVDCALCNQYVECLKENITPWTAKCVLSTGVKKQIARARTL